MTINGKLISYDGKELVRINPEYEIKNGVKIKLKPVYKKVELTEEEKKIFEETMKKEKQAEKDGEIICNVIGLGYIAFMLIGLWQGWQIVGWIIAIHILLYMFIFLLFGGCKFK